MNPDVSVCMATHNGARFLKPQLDSILPQLHSNDELIISDDGSGDDTVRIAAAYEDGRIKILCNKHSGSPSHNFEIGLSQCKGELIFLSDQDDVWMKDKIKRMKEALYECDLVLSDCAITDENLEVIHPSLFALNRTRQGLIYNLLRNCYTGCCMAFRRDVLLAALPFPAAVPAHDAWLGLVAEKRFRVGLVAEVLTYMRRHPLNYSTTGTRSGNTLYRKISHRVRLAKALINR